MRERGKRNGLMKGRFAGPVIITQAEFRRSSDALITINRN